MALTDKVKEISEEIKKTVEESGIKDTAISAGMIITDTAKKGKETIENKIEENRQKLQEQKQFLSDVQNETYTRIAENSVLYGKPMFLNVSSSKLLSYCNDFNKNIYNFYKSEIKKPLYFSQSIPARTIEKIKNIYEFKDDTEEILMCYYGGSKDNYVLTTNCFYFNIKHYNETLIYTLSIDLDKISEIEIDDVTNDLKINDVPLFKVDEDKKYILNKFFSKLKAQELSFSDDEISKEIEKLIDIDELEKIKESMSLSEKFIYFARSYNKNSESIICTSNKLIIKSLKVDGITVVNSILYKNIDYIDIEDLNDAISILNIFKQGSLEIIYKGSKIKINNIALDDAKKIVEIVNGLRKNNDDCINLNKESSEDIFVKIEKLSKLKDMGAINEDEFNEKKKELLARI